MPTADVMLFIHYIPGTVSLFYWAHKSKTYQALGRNSRFLLEGPYRREHDRSTYVYTLRLVSCVLLIETSGMYELRQSKTTDKALFSRSWSTTAN